MDRPTRNTDTTDELFVGYAPAFRGSAGWRHSFRQNRRAPGGGVVRRVVITNTEDPHKRLLVDAAEFPAAQRAKEYLQEARADANFEISDAAPRFGAQSFAFPGDQPRSLYFSRANLMIWIYSCGREQVLVESWADQILRDLAQEPSAEPRDDVQFRREPDDADRSPAIRLSSTLQWDRGEWAWRRYKAVGGTLSRAIDGDDVWLWPAAGAKDPTVISLAFEPGRETYRGRFTAGGAESSR